MPCFNPRTAWRVEGRRQYVFRSDLPGIVETVKVPCGHCFGCLKDRAAMMAMRCMHEVKVTPGGVHNCCFLTLTYDDEHLPEHASLSVGDWQAFMKAVRQHFNPPRRPDESESAYRARYVKIRFFMGAEYGEQKGRPHYHAILFGIRPADLVPLCKGKSGKMLYRSDTFDGLWKRGSVQVGSVTRGSAEYCARYCLKKVYGPLAENHYTRVDLETGEVVKIVPEFCLMSRRPGIGYGWFEKYGQHCYNGDFCIVDGRKVQVPKYYDKLMARTDWLKLQEVKDKRIARGVEQAWNNTPERLKVREVCAKAKMKFYTGSDSR